jgi:hypothetical protein
MITIQILGLDQYVVGHYSKDSTADIANLLETSEEDINFYAPYDSLLFHDGVEQTSWNTVIFVKLPKKFEVFENKLANYLIETLSDFSIHLEINFEYIEEGKMYTHINPDYPRYLTEKNIMSVNETEDDFDEHHHAEEEEDADPRDRADLDYNDPNQLYLGDAFEGRQADLDALERHQKDLKK